MINRFPTLVLTQVYGNFRPDLEKWNERIKTKGLLGGVPSSWATTSEIITGKDQLSDLLGDINLLWSRYYSTNRRNNY